MSFPETNWSVLALATLSGGEDEREAMDRLCREYWRPVSVFIRARGAPRERVDDLTQDFFLYLMKRGLFRKADPLKGRFRTFLLSALRQFLADDYRRNTRQKRGGGMEHAELTDAVAATETGDAAYDWAWAEQIFERVMERVKTATVKAAGEDAWEHLRKFLPGSTEKMSNEELGRALNSTEGAAKTRVSRLRQQFRDLLRAEVGRTVSAPHEIDEELAHLREALGKGPGTH